MGLLDLIPTVLTAGIILKTTDIVFDKNREIQSIHERARKNSREVI